MFIKFNGVSPIVYRIELSLFPTQRILHKFESQTAVKKKTAKICKNATSCQLFVEISASITRAHTFAYDFKYAYNPKGCTYHFC